MSVNGNLGSVLVVDDDKDPRELVVEFLDRSGYDVSQADGPVAALSALSKRSFDLVITDLKMPGMDGITLLKEVKDRDPDTVVVVMTGYGTIESAVKAMRAGAFDYVTKPFNLDEVGIAIQRAMEFRGLRIENETLKKELLHSSGFGELIGYAPTMREVFDMVARVADTDATVLLTGESGTGKEMVARTLHNKSSRANKPMIAVNCGAIPEELLESELFGHEKGAFTGAVQARMGRFEMAQGGTIFLDEIGDMSPNLQVKLLRVIQEREFERVGGERTIKVNVRVIAATRQDLEKLVEDGGFREDLYYRLNVIQIKLPPLRDRLDDLPILVEHFMEKHGRKKDRGVTGVSKDVMGIFSGYSWPGNVRELENVIERACILKGEGAITRAEVPEKITQRGEGGLGFRFQLPQSGIDFNMAVDLFERDLINQALTRSDGIKNRAAKLLSLGRTTLVEKMKKKKIMDASSTAKEP